MLPRLHEGDVIAGTPYVVVEALGEGGMGTVYEVRDSLLEVHRALKLIDVDIEPGEKREKAIREVLKEGRVIAKLHGHCPDHIVEVLTMGITSDRRGTPYLLMELVRGVTLSDLRRRHGGKLEANLVRQVALEILAALITVHENGIVHRDLKPANIMVEPVPGTFSGTRMKLIDFGITSEVGRRTVRQALTYRYGAPEQVQIDGPHRITAQTDLYALGLILYEAIAGHGPFDATCKTMPQFILAHLTQPAPPIASRVPGLPRILCEIVDSMLEKDPRKRPQSALECGEALASFDWDFSTTPSAETDKTERDMNTAVASAILGREEKRRREKEIEAERGPVAKPVEWPNGAPAQPAHAQPAGIVSTTLPSPGANDAPPRQRAVAVVEQGSALSRTASTQTAPVAVEVGDLPPNGPRGFGPLAPAAPARRFHVNETAPLPPELDTRGRDPSTFQGLLRTLAGDYGRGKQVRVAAVAIAAASVLGLAATEVFVSARASHASTAARTATSTSLALSSAAPTSPSPSLQASAAPSTLATVDALPAAVPATTVSSSASSPIQPVAAQSAASTAKVTHAASSSTKPTPRPAPSASAAGPVMVDLGDGVKVPMNMDRKLPGSGL